MYLTLLYGRLMHLATSLSFLTSSVNRLPNEPTQ